MKKADNLSLFIKNKIEKKFGKGIVLHEYRHNKQNFISSGSIGIDIVLGTGGYPLGRIIEIYGAEASGKTTMGLHAILNAQKYSKMPVFIDMEHCLDIFYMKRIGINISNMVIFHPDNGEQALEIMFFLIQSNMTNLVVVDSVAALVPKLELKDENIKDIQIGIHARLMSKMLRKLSLLIDKFHVTIIFTNQIRMKIGVLFGSNESTTGGVALRFYSSIRIEIRRIGNIKKSNEIIGTRNKIKIVKNKLFPPFKEIEFDILYGLGISKEGELIDLGLKMNVLKKKSNWITFFSNNLAYGKDNARFLLIKNKIFCSNINLIIFARNINYVCFFWKSKISIFIKTTLGEKIYV
jgi:recombination protein RecA